MMFGSRWERIGLCLVGCFEVKEIGIAHALSQLLPYFQDFSDIFCRLSFLSTVKTLKIHPIF